jgi:hypothetical protein
MRSGSWLWAIVLVASACDGSKFGPGEPPVIGGQGGGGVPGDEPDAEPVLGDGGVSGGLSGVVCSVADVRVPDTCVPIQRKGLLVGLEGLDHTPLDNVETDDQGRFTMAKPAKVDTVWITVSDPLKVYHFGATLHPLLVGSNAGLQERVILNSTYDGILASSLVNVASGHGVVFLRLVHGEAPLAGAVLGPLLGVDAYYDATDNPQAFSTVTPTKSTGFAAWFDVPPTNSARYQVTVGSVVTQHTAFAFADAVTFITDVN